MVRLVVLLAGCAVLASASMITVQPIMVGTLGDRVATDTTYAELIYQQMSMWVNVLPEQPISYYSGSTLSGLNLYATGGVNDNTNTFLGDASWQAPSEITVWYVDHIYANDAGTSQDRGVTFYENGRFGVAISLSTVANDSFAHELAHMLTWYTYGHPSTLYFTCADPNVTYNGTPASGCLSGGGENGAHDATPTNLLASGGIRLTPGSTTDIYLQGGTYDQITYSQSSFMVLHTDFVQDGTPEPATVVLSGSALALLLLARRRRAA